MKRTELKLQTLKLRPETIQLLRTKAKELDITQSALINFSISRLRDEDIEVLNSAKELVYG